MGLATQVCGNIVGGFSIIPEATYAELPEVLNAWSGGLCDGLALARDSHPSRDDRLITMES